MKRREFISRAAWGLGAVWPLVHSVKTSRLWAQSPVPEGARFSAADTVTLGNTGIRTSRLACGTGTAGFNHRSNQGALGVQGLSDLLVQGYEHGLLFFDTADAYGTHPHVRAALKRVAREKVTVMTKSWARDAATMRADIERYRRELDTDYLDLCLMHCLSEADWTERFRGAMDALEEARQKGIVRAHGCSCHSIEALRAAAKSGWVQVQLARINPIGSHMDADPATVVAVLREMRAQGKAIVGMKILGQGDMRKRVDEALRYALSLNLLDAFTIGAESRQEQLDLMQRISAVRV